MNACAYSETVTSVLRRIYGSMRHGAEYLARGVDTSPRTARNWLDGKNAPRGAELIRLMAECDELRREIDRLVEEEKCRKGLGSTSVIAGSDGAEIRRQSASGLLPSTYSNTASAS
ncbi:hypothetical protein [Acetobacter aceti]|uniref:hypothetical protein n=1 Tax=Acetobacter aceti TaxID=435 RepID=UPI0015E13907|nr:hypothetical protein [Acetobacter aceti]